MCCVHLQKLVKAVSKLKEKCVMCKEEDASVTLQPCKHTYCQGLLFFNYQYMYLIVGHAMHCEYLHFISACCRRLRVCFECRVLIESKDGLGVFLIIPCNCSMHKSKYSKQNIYSIHH